MTLHAAMHFRAHATQRQINLARAIVAGEDTDATRDELVALVRLVIVSLWEGGYS